MSEQPIFNDPAIAQAYRDGAFRSRLDAELADALSASAPQDPHTEATISLHSADAPERLKRLNVLALIHDGEVLPILDIGRISGTMTLTERVQLYHLAARTLLEAIHGIQEYQEQARTRSIDDDEGDFACRV